MDWAYISGFFDADGSLTLIKKNQRVYPSVNFHNTSLKTINTLRDFIFSSVDILGYIATYIPKNTNHEIQHTLRYTYYKSAIPVLDQMQIIHPKKKHRKEIVYSLNSARVFKKPKKYKKLAEEFFNTSIEGDEVSDYIKSLTNGTSN